MTMRAKGRLTGQELADFDQNFPELAHLPPEVKAEHRAIGGDKTSEDLLRIYSGGATPLPTSVTPQPAAAPTAQPLRKVYGPPKPITPPVLTPGVRGALGGGSGGPFGLPEVPEPSAPATVESLRALSERYRPAKTPEQIAAEAGAEVRKQTRYSRPMVPVAGQPAAAPAPAPVQTRDKTLSPGTEFIYDATDPNARANIEAVARKDRAFVAAQEKANRTGQPVTMPTTPGARLPLQPGSGFAGTAGVLPSLKLKPEEIAAIGTAAARGVAQPDYGAAGVTQAMAAPTTRVAQLKANIDKYLHKPSGQILLGAGDDVAGTFYRFFHAPGSFEEMGKQLAYIDRVIRYGGPEANRTTSGLVMQLKESDFTPEAWIEVRRIKGGGMSDTEKWKLLVPIIRADFSGWSEQRKRREQGAARYAESQALSGARATQKQIDDLESQLANAQEEADKALHLRRYPGKNKDGTPMDPEELGNNVIYYSQKRDRIQSRLNEAKGRLSSTAPSVPGGAPTAGGEPPRIAGDAEYDALPANSEYVDPEGNLRRKS